MLCNRKPMKTIKYNRTLFYYDGPQVFEARDMIGGHYIAVMVNSDNSNDQYLVTGVSPDRLRDFRSGIVDLRTLLIESKEQDQYLTTIASDLEEPLELNQLSISLSDSGFLPDAGFVLHDRPSSHYVLREAQERDNLVFEITAEPPEAASQHRIRANTLAEMLSLVQNMVKHAYRVVTRKIPPKYRRRDEEILDVVVPASAGSFQIVLEAANIPSLFGGSELSRAFRQIDLLFEDTSDPQQTLNIVKEYQGHLAKSYLNLLRFLVEQRTGLSYSWAEPRSEYPSSRAVSQSEAVLLVGALSHVSNLGIETVTIEGRFDRFNRGTGNWGLLTKERKRTGKVRTQRTNLDGLEVGAWYRFHCEEEIEEIGITGKERRTLYLVSHEPM